MPLPFVPPTNAPRMPHCPKVRHAGHSIVRILHRAIGWAKAGAPKAVVATARKLAIIYYKMVVDKQAFNPSALVDYQEKYKQKKINQLKHNIAKLEAA